MKKHRTRRQKVTVAALAVAAVGFLMAAGAVVVYEVFASFTWFAVLAAVGWLMVFAGLAVDKAVNE